MPKRKNQCQKLLSKPIKKETKNNGPARCKIPLRSDGTCPEHGKDTK